jgi:hypothetical protein
MTAGSGACRCAVGPEPAGWKAAFTNSIRTAAFRECPARSLTLDPATTDETLATIFGARRLDLGRTPAQLQTQRDAGAEPIAALQPRNSVEASYAARAAAAHYGSMECFRRTMLPGTPDNAGLRWQGKALALSRMNTEMVRALRECQAASPLAQPATRPAPAAAGPLPGPGRGAPTRCCCPGEVDWYARPHAR